MEDEARVDTEEAEVAGSIVFSILATSQHINSSLRSAVYIEERVRQQPKGGE